MASVSTIPNIGPATEAEFARAGIRTAEELRGMGADAAYAALLSSGTRPHFIAYYALVMGLQGRPWNDCAGAEKEALKRRFDGIKARAARDVPPGIEDILDRIGVRQR